MSLLKTCKYCENDAYCGDDDYCGECGLSIGLWGMEWFISHLDEIKENRK